MKYPKLLLLFLLLSLQLNARQDLDTWIIQLENGISISSVENELQALEKSCFVDLRQMSSIPNIMVIKSDCDLTEKLENLKGLLNIEESIELEFRKTPNDALYDQQWQMGLIQAPEVWDITTGGQTAQNDEIVIAVIDEQYNVFHPDLAQSFWVNKHEVPDDGLDNDNNGYVDDYLGFHFVDSLDEHTTGGGWHGTAVSGIIGAQGDNEIGVAGVNWYSKILIMDPINPSEKVEEAMLYIYDLRKRYNESNGLRGAYIVALNMSFGATGKFADKDFPIMCALMDSMGQEGILTVGAAPNNLINIDEAGDLPNDCKSNYLLSVTNSDERDELSGAGYGPMNMDLSAPGDGSLTTRRDSSYSNFGGASAAAPYVSGTVGLLYAAGCDRFIELSKKAPAQAATIIREAILNNVDPSLDMEGMTTTGGRLNIYNAVLDLKEQACFVDSSQTGISYISLPRSGSIARIVLSLSELTAYKVELFDAAGRLWMERRILPTLSPVYELDLDVSLYPSGGYVVRLTGGSEEDVEKFLIVH